LRTSLVLFDEDNACTYDFLVFLFLFVRLFFLKNFEISLTSLGNLAEMGGGSLSILTGFSIFSLSLLLVLTGLSFEVNFDKTFCLKELLFLSKTKKIENNKANEVLDLKDIGEAAWNFISAIYNSGWNSLIVDIFSYSMQRLLDVLGV